jgi:histidinol-phosphate aminotransferase
MIEQLIRPHLRKFQPYRSARSETRAGDIFLDANELSLGSTVSFNGVALNRYPDPLQEELREKLAQRLAVPQEMLFAGSGSDEVIDLLVRLFCEPGSESVAIFEPTYGIYRVAANVNNVSVISIQLDENFQIRPLRSFETLTRSAKLVFLCSPNNPTGNVLRRDDILRLCDAARGIIILDHAYVEFAPPLSDCTRDVMDHENLVVLRTLSKAWGLAGIRLGYCVAHPDVVSHLLRIKEPYNINAMTSHCALAALDRPDFCRDSVEAIKKERTRLAARLAQLPQVVRVYPSEANFLLVEFKDAASVFDTLARKGIIVRRRHEVRLTSCLRITVGIPCENDILLSTIAEAV